MAISIYYFSLINIVSYIMMGRDRRAAKAKIWRTPEKYFWFIALLGGSLGIFLGTRSPLYHKAAKQSFTIGIPMLILVQVVMVVWIAWVKD